VTPEMFVQTTCEDLQLPSQFNAMFLLQLKQQILDFQTHTVNTDPSSDCVRISGTLDEEADVWWERWRKKLRTEDGFVGIGDCQTDVDESRRKLVVEIPEPSEHAGVEMNTDIQPTPVDTETPLETIPGDPNSHPPPASQRLNYEMRILIKVSVLMIYLVEKKYSIVPSHRFDL
jgi:hypothetical protein